MAINGEVITPLFILCDPLLFAVLLLLIHKTDRRIQNTALNVLEVIVLLIFSTVGYFAAGIIRTLKTENPYYFVISFLILFAFEILLLYVVYHRKRTAYYRILSLEYKKQFEEEYIFFKDYKTTQEDTIRFHHDLKNHMLLLRKMLAKGEYAKAEEYFGNLSDNTPEGSANIATGCETVDMIIGIKSEQMEELGITFHFRKLLSVEMSNPSAEELQKDGSSILSVAATRKTGGSRRWLKALGTGQRLKAPSTFSSFKSLLHLTRCLYP